MRLLSRYTYGHNVRLTPARVRDMIFTLPCPRYYKVEESTFTEHGRTYAQTTIRIVEDVTPSKEVPRGPRQDGLAQDR